MKIKKREIENYIIFDLEEDISIDSARELETEIKKEVSEGQSSVVLNIKRVTYVNSFALGVLIKIMQDVESQGHQFYLMNVNHNVETLLKVTGVLDRFKFFKG